MIYVDYDSTLNNLAEVWLDELNLTHGTNYTIKDVKHWDWLYDTFGDNKASKALHDVYYEVKPNIGSKSFMQFLKNPTILTASHIDDTTKKDEMIKNQYGDVPIIHEKAKYKYANAESVLIDDNFENVYKFVDTGGYGILFTNYGKYQYNDVIWRHKRYVRLDAYEDIIEKLKEWSFL